MFRSLLGSRLPLQDAQQGELPSYVYLYILVLIHVERESCVGNGFDDPPSLNWHGVLPLSYWLNEGGPGLFQFYLHTIYPLSGSELISRVRRKHGCQRGSWSQGSLFVVPTCTNLGTDALHTNNGHGAPSDITEV